MGLCNSWTLLLAPYLRLGAEVGQALGTEVGITVGVAVGQGVATEVGISVGQTVGRAVGTTVGVRLTLDSQNFPLQVASQFALLCQHHPAVVVELSVHQDCKNVGGQPHATRKHFGGTDIAMEVGESEGLCVGA